MLAANSCTDVGSKVLWALETLTRAASVSPLISNSTSPAHVMWPHPPEMVDPDGGRSTPPSVNSGTQPSSMLKMLSVMDASTTCIVRQLADGSAKTFASSFDGGNPGDERNDVNRYLDDTHMHIMLHSECSVSSVPVHCD